MKIVRMLCCFTLFLVVSVGMVAAVCDPLQYEVQEGVLLCSGNHTLEGSIMLSGDDYTFDCDGSTLIGSALTPTFILNNTNEVTLKNCNIDTAHVGIFVDNSMNTLITDNSITSTERGIYFTKSVTNARVRTNAIYLSAREAIGVHGTNSLFEANELFDNFYGFYIYNKSKEHTLKYNRVDGNTFGAVIEGNTNTLELNGFDENGEAIRLLYTFDNVIDNNRMFGSRSNGVFVYQSELNRLTNNNITENDKSGIVFLGSPQNIFTNNHVVGNKAAGVFLTSQSHENQVTFNSFKGNSLYSININSSDLNSVTDNVFMQAPFVIEDNSLGTLICPANVYENDALGPLCNDGSTVQEDVVVPEPKTVPLPNEAPIVVGSQEEEVTNEPHEQEESVDIVAEPLDEEIDTSDSALGDVMMEETQVLSLPTQIETKDLQGIVDEILEKDELKGHDSLLAKKEIIDKIRKTEKKVVISKNIKTSRVGDQLYTLVNTTVRVAADMEEVNVYESIPKECAENIEHLQFGVMNYPGVTFEVVKADPLVVWKFPRVQKGDILTVSYTVRNAVSEVPRTLTVESPDNVINIRQELICNHNDAPKTVVLAQKIRAFSWMMFFLVGIIILIPVALVTMSKSREE